ncbi:MAG: WbqC family protein [Bacteroidales bacterium]|nr:WbqC family protein [Bacteroidales bacterium]
MVLDTQYFPTVEFFAVAAENSTVFLEAHGKYCKQSYRNRCRILSANGALDLNVPIVHDGRTLVSEVLVDYSTPWVNKTERALDSAYYNSAFFEYYRDELFEVLGRGRSTLWELNLDIMEHLALKLGLRVEFKPTETFRGADIGMHPKKESSYRPKEYWQVFSQKFGFVPGLSVIDLLFNEGPDSICFLK